MYYFMLILVLFLNNLWMVCSIFTPVIEIKQGKLRGLRSLAGQNSYYGVPYAVSKRFQPPQKPPAWEGTLDALNILSSCAQTVSILTYGTEECHHLDIYTPESAQKGDKLPVFVFIHGGAYYYGSKGHYNPEFLVVKNVVSVILNYRVGVLGFLCLNGIANLGLQDQVAALKWIKKNIAAFGGDPDNVTISGQSAGAVSVGMHLLSKQSKGLFHKAILMSGSPLSPWAFNVEPLKPAFEDAKKLGTVKTEQDVYNVFAKAPLDKLLAATKATLINTRYFQYSPCVDSNLTKPFFHDEPYNIIRSGEFNQVPVMIGFTNIEGLLFYGVNDDDSLKYWDENFVDNIPAVFSWCSQKEKKKIAHKIRKYYFGNKRIDKFAAKEAINYYSDWIAYSSITAFADLLANVSNQPIYSYVFSYEGERNFVKDIFGSSIRQRGATHADDLFYIFKPGGISTVLTTADRRFIDRLTIMISNFMRYSNPTPRLTKLITVQWPPIIPESSKSLILDRSITVKKTPEKLEGKFFFKMLCDYGLRGYVPCESAQRCNRE